MIMVCDNVEFEEILFRKNLVEKKISLADKRGFLLKLKFYVGLGVKKFDLDKV